MSEYSNMNLVLGIIGTVTGIIALFISWWTLRRERPRLKVSVQSCEHHFTNPAPSLKNVSFWVKFQIRNVGDRGTTIIDVGLTLDDYWEKGHFKKLFWYANEKLIEDGKIWLNAHDVVDIRADFVAIDYPSEDKDLLGCTFVIYHTHGAKTVEYMSQKRK